MLEARGMDIGYFRVRPARDFVPTNRGLERVRTPSVAVTHDDRRMSVAIGSSNCQHGLREIGDAILTGRVEPEGDGIILKIEGLAERSTYTTPLLTRDDLFPPKWHSRFTTRANRMGRRAQIARTAGDDNEWAHRALRAGVRIFTTRR